MGVLKSTLKILDIPNDSKSFPIKAYHGTNKDITSFDVNKLGDTTKSNSAKKAFWFTDDAKTTASGYADLAGSTGVDDLIRASEAAERRGDWDAANSLMRQAEELDQVVGRGENVMPVQLGGNMKKIDMDGVQYDPDDVNLSEILDKARTEGFDGVEFKNFSDEAGYGNYNPSTHYAVFEPKNIRSKFAKFNPSKRDSPDLLSGVAGGGAGTGLLSGTDLSFAKKDGRPFLKTMGEFGLSALRGVPLSILDSFDSLEELGQYLGFIPDNSAYVPEDVKRQVKQISRDRIPNYEAEYATDEDRKAMNFVGGLFNPSPF